MMLLKDTQPVTVASVSSLSSSTSSPKQQQQAKTMSSKRSRNQAAMRIRSRYLHRLGVAGADSCSTSISSSASCDSTVDTIATGSPKRKQHARRRSRPDEIEFQPLKGCEDEESYSITKPIIHYHKSKSTSVVSFENFVVIHPIPNLDAYSEEMKNAIWTNSAEMESEVMRNCLEFASEGMHWQDTLEEEDFFEYNNELVHPVHILNRHCSLQQNFLMGMRAARQTTTSWCQ